MKKHHQEKERRIVGWRLWHVGDKRWCFSRQTWNTQREAFMAKISFTRGKRNHIANGFRVCARVVSVLADGTSPMRDEIQKQWDQKT